MPRPAPLAALMLALLAISPFMSSALHAQSAQSAQSGERGEAAAPEMPVLDVPVDPAAYQEASRGEPYLQRLSMQNAFGYNGMGTLLLAPDELPIADRPHIDWADPLPPGPEGQTGPIRIGYFVNHNGHGQGDMAAIARRLDCELYTVEIPYAPLYDIHRYTADHELGWLARKSLKMLQRELDVIVLDGGSQYLPVDVQQRIVEKAKQGTGVYVDDLRGFSPHGQKKRFTEDDALPSLMPFTEPTVKTHHDRELGDPVAFKKPAIIDDVPAATAFTGLRYRVSPIREGFEVVATHGGQPMWYAGRVGDGRVIGATYNGLFHRAGRQRLPLSDRYHEYQAAGLAKIIRWLAGREPAVTLDVNPPEDAAAGEPFELGVTLNNTADTPRTLELTAALRDFDFRTLSEQTVTRRVPAGETLTTQVPMPAVPAGARFVGSVIARNADGASVDWGSAMVQTKAPESLTVSTDKEIYEPGENVRITAKLSDAIDASYDAEVRVFDDTGRLLFQKSAPFEDGALEMSHTIAPPVTAPHHVEVTARRDGQAVRLGEALFYAPRFGWDDWRSGLWPHWWTRQYQSEAQHRALMQWMGLDTSSSAHGREPVIQSKLGLGILRLNDAGFNPKTLYKAFDAAKQRSQHSLGSAINWAQRYGVVAWNFQDERHLRNDPGFSEQATEAFRDYLREQYDGDIAALNEAWGASLKSFDAAEPWTKDDLPTEPGDLGGWIDTRLFIRDRMNRIDSANARMVRDNVPGEHVLGIDAFTDMNHHAASGVDWGSMLTGHFNTYYPYVAEDLAVFRMLKGLAPEDAPFPVVGGEKMDPKRDYYAKAWRQTLAGGDGGVIGLSRFYGITFIHQFGKLYRSAKWINESDKPLREGGGKLLMEAERQTDPVAIMYGYPSMMANLALGKLVDPHNHHMMQRPSRASMESMQQMLADNGVTADWLTDQQVADGALDGHKLLILPDYTSVALSDATCEAIERFVRGGGTVLADMSPAVYDANGNLRDQGGLDELFGVTRNTLAYGARPSDYLVNGMKQRDPRLPINHWFMGEYFERGLETTTGKALGEHIFLDDPAPAFVLNQTGDGHTVLLNFLETQYGRHPYKGPMSLMRNVLDLAGVEPDVHVTDPHGGRRWGYQLTRHREGENLYVGLYRMSQTPSYYSDTTILHLPEKRHVYVVGGVENAAEGVMRSRRYVGHVDRAALSLRGMGSALIAALRYRVDGLSMEMPQRAAAGATIHATLKLHTADPPDAHVVHVTVTRPNGMKHRHYSRNVVVRDGEARFTIPLAINDATGAWHIQARDVASGETTTHVLELDAPQ